MLGTIEVKTRSKPPTYRVGEVEATAVDAERRALAERLDAAEQARVTSRHAEVLGENRDKPVLQSEAKSSQHAPSPARKTLEKAGGVTHKVVLYAVAGRVEHDVQPESLAKLARRVGPVELARVVLRKLVLDDDRPDQDPAEKGESRRRSDPSARGDREALRVEEEAEEGGGEDAADSREEGRERAGPDREIEREEARAVAPVVPRSL